MARHFMRGILAGGQSHFNLFCFDENTADAIDDFVDANKDNHNENIVVPTGESKKILNAFFGRIREQIFLIKGHRERNHNFPFSSISVNHLWSYVVGVSWDGPTDVALEKENLRAFLTLARIISHECSKIDEIKDCHIAKKEALEKGE